MRLKNKINKKITGAAMIETLYVFPIVLVALFAIIQLGLIFQSKSNLEYAALMAARIGASQSLNEASFQAMKEEVRHRMEASDALKTGKSITDADEINKVSLKVLRPNDDVFSSWSDGACPGADCLIPNDNLLYRDPNELRGSSGQELSIQDANLLQLQVSYEIRTGVPLMAEILNGLADLTGQPNVSVTAVTVVRMQSPATATDATKCYIAGLEDATC